MATTDNITAGSIKASTPGTVDDFQRETLQRAQALGYKVHKDGQVWTVSKGKVKLTIQHSSKGYVRTVTVGANPVILPGQKLKHHTLQGLLVKLAN